MNTTKAAQLIEQAIAAADETPNLPLIRESLHAALAALTPHTPPVAAPRTIVQYAQNVLACREETIEYVFALDAYNTALMCEGIIEFCELDSAELRLHAEQTVREFEDAARDAQLSEQSAAEADEARWVSMNFPEGVKVVGEHDGWVRFKVDSRSEPIQHTVLINSDTRACRCTCKGFVYCIEPKSKRDNVTPNITDNRYNCHHCRQAVIGCRVAARTVTA